MMSDQILTHIDNITRPDASLTHVRRELPWMDAVTMDDIKQLVKGGRPTRTAIEGVL